MEVIQRISESEMEIMRIIWTHGETITTAEIYKALPKDKKWAQSTVLTFLSRLCDKGILATTKKGVSNIFTVKVTQSQYLAYETKHFLDTVHGGSPKSFIAALLEDEQISHDEIEKLKKWFMDL